MALAAADLRLGNSLVYLFTKRAHLHPPLKNGGNGTFHSDLQLHVLTGICAGNIRHGACFTQVTRPSLTVGLEQTALLVIAATEIIAI